MAGGPKAISYSIDDSTVFRRSLVYMMTFAVILAARAQIFENFGRGGDAKPCGAGEKDAPFGDSQGRREVFGEAVGCG